MPAFCEWSHPASNAQSRSAPENKIMRNSNMRTSRTWNESFFLQCSHLAGSLRSQLLKGLGLVPSIVAKTTKHEHKFRASESSINCLSHAKFRNVNVVVLRRQPIVRIYNTRRCQMLACHRLFAREENEACHRKSQQSLHS